MSDQRGSDIHAAAEAVAAYMFPACAAATAAAALGARTVASLIEESANVKTTPSGRGVRLAFAEEAITAARAALDSACQTRSLLIETRLLSLAAMNEAGDDAFGPKCLKEPPKGEASVTTLRAA